MASSTAFARRHLLEDHLTASRAALAELETHLAELDAWSAELAEVLASGRRLLLAGNGGSAALAAHLAAELVGRFRDERVPCSAIALHAESATFSAVGNDYGFEEVFARQVVAHGRADDVLLALSTSGRSPNLLRAIERARGAGLRGWALTGPGPNPLAAAADRSICVAAPSTAAAQEAHQVAVHLLCVGFDDRLACRPPVADGSRADGRSTERAVALGRTTPRPLPAPALPAAPVAARLLVAAPDQAG